MAPMNSHASTYPKTGTPGPPVLPEALPLAVVAVGTAVLLLIGAPPL
jgi:hypothetical protein